MRVLASKRCKLIGLMRVPALLHGYRYHHHTQVCEDVVTTRLCAFALKNDGEIALVRYRRDRSLAYCCAWAASVLSVASRAGCLGQDGRERRLLQRMRKLGKRERDTMNSSVIAVLLLGHLRCNFRRSVSLKRACIVAVQNGQKKAARFEGRICSKTATAKEVKRSRKTPCHDSGGRGNFWIQTSGRKVKSHAILAQYTQALMRLPSRLGLSARTPAFNRRLMIAPRWTLVVLATLEQGHEVPTANCMFAQVCLTRWREWPCWICHSGANKDK